MQNINDRLAGKDAVYKENWTLLHLTIEGVRQNGDTVDVHAKINKTPGFTSTEDKNYVFRGMHPQTIRITGEAYGYGSISPIESLESLFDDYKRGSNTDTNPKYSSREVSNSIFFALMAHYEEKIIPKFIKSYFRSNEDPHVLEIIEKVFIQNPESFIRWPKRQIKFARRKREKGIVQYTEEEKILIKSAGIKPAPRSNGPAIMSFLLAGGERPIRNDGNGWSIHHIYDGKFPCPNKKTTCHAVKNESHFTNSAGLTALSPAADGIVNDSACLAWLLRIEAFKRFRYDPDDVFHINAW